MGFAGTEVLDAKTTEIKSLQSQVLDASVGVVAANLTLVFESVIHSEGFP